MNSFDKYTGKVYDKPSDRLPKQLKEKCCNGHDTHLIALCLRCGAPVCCPDCCADNATPTERLQRQLLRYKELLKEGE